MTKIYFTDEQLISAVKQSISLSQVLRILGYSKLTGGRYSHLKRRLLKINLDVTHFKGQASNKGIESPNKKTAKEILVNNPKALYRTHAITLRRALLESGIEYCCSVCKIVEWNSIFLQLEIDHINNDFKDNRLENLRFICPNCHCQK